jgi:hypothetical protein
MSADGFPSPQTPHPGPSTQARAESNSLSCTPSSGARGSPLTSNTAVMKKLVLLLLSLLVSCAHHSPVFWGWGEWAGADVAGVGDDLLAGFDWSELPGVIASIDGNRVGTGYKKAKLRPGRHVIEYAYSPAEFGAHPTGIIEIDLAAGHLYEFRVKLSFWCMPRRFAVWVDDKTTGEAVWGKRPDWPSWWL